MELEIGTRVLIADFVLAAVLGFVAARTSFCTMGAVSDWVSMGDTGRLRAWLLATVVAMAGAVLLELFGVVDLSDSRIPYRSATFAWPRYVLGGLLLGVGMTLCSGCGSKNLIRIGGGNLKSILVVLVAGGAAYFMTRSDFYDELLQGWFGPLSLELAAYGIDSQEIAALLAGLTRIQLTAGLRLVVAATLVLLVLCVVFRSREFRSSLDNVLGGTVVGTVVLGGWYLTGGPWGQAWIETAALMDESPPAIGVQSYSFIASITDTLVYLHKPVDTVLITFGVAALAGVVSGAFLCSMLSGNFRIEWFVSVSDFFRHMVGAVLIGIGGVLGLGCSIGQGVSGASTLALGSFVTLGSMVLGAALSTKVQLYMMVYEDQASLADALVSGLVDLRLLPKKMRKLEPI